MKKRLRTLSFLVFVLVLAAACGPVLSESATPLVDPQSVDEETSAQELPAEQEQEEGQPVLLPDWYSSDLTDVNTGMVFRVADFQGKVILVETMAIWCSNCLRQQNEVKKLHDLLGDKDDFISLGINIDPNEDVPQLTGYVKNNGFDWLYVVAADELVNEISELYGPQFLNPPSTPMLIIDRTGEAHLLPFGIKSAEDLQSFLMPFFDEI